MAILSAITALYDVNNSLAKRVRGVPYIYVSVIMSCSVTVMIFAGVPLFTDQVEFANMHEVRSFFNVSCYLLVSFDVLFICLRYSARTLIEPNQIIVFPISQHVKILMYLAILIFDYRSTIYAAFGIIVVISQIIQFQFFHAMLAGLIIVLLLLNITIWMSILLDCTADYFMIHRSNAILVYVIMTLIFNVALNYKHGILLNVVPFTSYAGNGLFSLETGDSMSLLVNFSLLFGAIFLGFALLLLTGKRR